MSSYYQDNNDSDYESEGEESSDDEVIDGLYRGGSGGRSSITIDEGKEEYKYIDKNDVPISRFPQRDFLFDDIESWGDDEESLTFKPVDQWDDKKVGEFISGEVGLPQYRENCMGIDGKVLLRMSVNDLNRKLGIEDIGHIRKLEQFISYLKRTEYYRNQRKEREKKLFNLFPETKLSNKTLKPLATKRFRNRNSKFVRIIRIKKKNRNLPKEEIYKDTIGDSFKMYHPREYIELTNARNKRLEEEKRIQNERKYQPRYYGQGHIYGRSRY